jgi:hypothetical protein
MSINIAKIIPVLIIKTLSATMKTLKVMTLLKRDS